MQWAEPLLLAAGQAPEAANEAVRLGVADGIIERNGSWYRFEDETTEQRRDAVVSWLREDPSGAATLAYVLGEDGEVERLEVVEK